MTPSIAVFGNLTIDDLVFPDGSTRWAVPGGSAVYAAMGIALWTERASIVAPLGADYPVDTLDARIDLSRCRRVPRTLRNWGLYEEDGQRHFVSRSATRNWNEFSPEPADAASGPQAAAHIAPIPRSIVPELIRELRKAGAITVSFDLDDHDLLGNADLDAMGELLDQVDLFLPSRQDVHAMFPDVEPLEGLRRLRSLAPGVALIAMKCGGEGVIAHVAGAAEWIHVPAMPVELVDVTGAGDAFCGGVLAGFVEQKNPVEALLCGTVSASFCVEGLGFAGLAAATKEEARGRLELLRHQVRVRSISA
jgi:sugar/nucleoside kinase (ribokinase family)